MKYAFFDLDGTLLNDQLVLEERTAASLKRMIRNGVGVSVISARTLKSILPFMEGIDIDYAAALNGSVIYDAGRKKTVFSEKIEEAAASGILDEVLSHNISANIFTSDITFITSYSNDPANRKYQMSLDHVILKDRKECGDILSVELIFEKDAEMKDFADRFRGIFGDLVNMSDGGYRCLEINKKGIDKGFALEYIAGILKIATDDTVAVGDSHSDLPMINKAGIGIAMANAAALLKQHAGRITISDNNNNGAASFVERMLFEERENK